MKSERRQVLTKSVSEAFPLREKKFPLSSGAVKNVQKTNQVIEKLKSKDT